MSGTIIRRGTLIRGLVLCAVVLPTMTAIADVADKDDVAVSAAVRSSVKRMAVLREFIRGNGYLGLNYHKTADEVEAGKYKSGAEVRKALDQRQVDSAAEIAIPIQLPGVQDATAARHVDAKPLTQAQYNVRTAAMLPGIALADYDIERSSLPEDRKQSLLDLSRKLQSELAELVKRADGHPEESDALVAQVIAKKRLAEQQMKQTLTPEEQTQLGKAKQVVIYEAAVVHRIRSFRVPGADGIERHLKAVVATDEQRAAIGGIRDDLAKREDEILDRQSDEIAGLTGTFTTDLWQRESEVAAREAIRAVRKVLTPEQLAKWDASLPTQRSMPPQPPKPSEPLPF